MTGRSNLEKRFGLSSEKNLELNSASSANFVVEQNPSVKKTEFKEVWKRTGMERYLFFLTVATIIAIGVSGCNKDKEDEATFHLGGESTYYSAGFGQEIIIVNNSGNKATFDVTLPDGKIEEILEGVATYFPYSESLKVTAHIGLPYLGTFSIIVSTKGGGAQHRIYLSKD